jgi:hypothetical protein
MSAATSHEGSVRERPHHGQRRRGMLRDLAAVAGRLSEDELHVLLTIAVRAWVGPVCVLERSGDGVPAELGGEAGLAAPQAVMAPAGSLALSQWQAVARASAPEPARAREQVGFSA